MKTWPVVLLVLTVAVLITPVSFAQKSESNAEAVPKYDISKEAKFKGVVDEVKDRTCPISGVFTGAATP